MTRRRIDIDVRDVMEGESRKSWRRRHRRATVLHNKEWRRRSRDFQRQGKDAVRCSIRFVPVYTRLSDLPEWSRYVKRGAIAKGTVGGIHWYVSPGGMPSLNAYLILPTGHPWLDVRDEDDYTFAGGEEYAPREYTYRKGPWIGVDSAHYNDVWNVDELRAHVKPWPTKWARVIDVFGGWPPESLGMLNDGSAVPWTVDAWVTSATVWATAAELARVPEEKR
jgi:hypothetical protein